MLDGVDEMRARRVALIAMLGLAVAACSSMRTATTVVSAYQATGLLGDTTSDLTGGEARAWTPDDEFLISSLRDSIDETDRPVALEAQFRALELHGPGSTVRWSNPRTQIRGEVVPGPLYSVNARQCRDFRHTIENAESSESVRASACRHPDGSWELLE